MDVVRKAGDEQCIDQSRGRRNRQRPSVDIRSVPSLRSKQLVARRVVDCADFSAAVYLEPERRAEDRKAVGVIRGAIERVEDPPPPRRRTR